MVLLHYRVPGGSGSVLFGVFFPDLSREGVWRGILGDFWDFGKNLGRFEAILGALGGPCRVNFEAKNVIFWGPFLL